MSIRQLESAIHWLEYVADRTRNETQAVRCLERAARLRRELRELKREQAERALNRGLVESAAWYDTSADLK
jgi:hypothetical protein